MVVVRVRAAPHRRAARTASPSAAASDAKSSSTRVMPAVSPDPWNCPMASRNDARATSPVARAEPREAEHVQRPGLHRPVAQSPVDGERGLELVGPGPGSPPK